jgi:hypothetical protein
MLNNNKQHHQTDHQERFVRRRVIPPEALNREKKIP